jgi:hypothetical protein
MLEHWELHVAVRLTSHDVDECNVEDEECGAEWDGYGVRQDHNGGESVGRQSHAADFEFSQRHTLSNRKRNIHIVQPGVFKYQL